MANISIKDQSNSQPQMNPSDTEKLRAEIQNLNASLEELRPQLLLATDKNFDSNAYRKVLETEIKERAVTRIQAWFGTVIAVVSVVGIGGMLFYADYKVKENLNKIVEEKAPALIEGANQAFKENLITLLRASSEGSELAKLQIKSNDKYRELIAEFINPFKADKLEPITEFQQELSKLAIDYAGKARDSELDKALFAVLNSSAPPSELKEKAFQALLQSSVGDADRFQQVLQQVIIPASKNLEKNEFWETMVKPLATFEDVAGSQEVGQIMHRALTSSNKEVVKSALIFYILNPSQWQEDYLKDLNAKKEVLSNHDKELVMALITASTPESQEKASEQLSTAIENASSSTNTSDRSGSENKNTSLSLPHLRELRKYFALRLLQTGNLDGFNETIVGNEDYYTPEEWQTKVYALFPSARDLFSTKPVGNHDDQDQLLDWSYSSLLYWDNNNASPQYQEFNEQDSVERLKAGELDQFLTLMSLTYYKPEVWKAQVYPLFPDAKKLFSTAPTGAEDEQDQLWDWVKENKPQWNPNLKHYRIPSP